MSSAELSRDIAHLVSRALEGEPLDSASSGEALAEKYPHLGMSAELIGKAIARTAGMMELVLEKNGSDGEPRQNGGGALDSAPAETANGHATGGAKGKARDHISGSNGDAAAKPEGPAPAGPPEPATIQAEPIRSALSSAPPVLAAARGTIERVALFRRALFGA